MTTQTPLDAAHAAMEAAPDDTAARLAWFDRLSATELFLLLEAEAGGETIRPSVFSVEGADLVLVFDREERLTAFSGGAAPYIALSGRALADMLAGQSLGLAVNLGTAAEMVLEAEAVAWLAGTLAPVPQVIDDRIDEIRPPEGLPEALLTALDARLASAHGRARLAYLAATRRAGGQRGHLVAFIDPAPGAEGALARLVSEVLTFSGLEAAALDVGFFRSDEAMAERLARAGLRFDLPDPVMPASPAAPGSDPDRPPKLR